MRLAMVGISANGKVQASFRRRPEVLPLPFFGQSWPASAVPVTVATNGKLSVIVVVRPTAKRSSLHSYQREPPLFLLHPFVT